MKKALKYLLYIIIALVAYVLIAGLFIKKDFHFERSIIINAPQQKVWEQTNNLKAIDKWSPFDDSDPNIQKTFTGVDGAVGSSSNWKGNKEVGEGSQTITKITEPSFISLDLNFKEPFESQAVSTVTLVPEGAGTRATWAFDSKFPYPMNAISMFMGVESAIEGEFTKGLNSLKQLSEQAY
jgi:uncharacterized protein YndB with AHSA1/START domain